MRRDHIAFPLAPRCEGYRKYGSFMTLGPREWEQCKNPAVMLVRVDQRFVDQREVVVNKNVRCCAECYQEFLKRAPGIPHKIVKERRK
jgi:hypothetical protein